MKAHLTISAFFILSTAFIWGFDPAGPPPKKTLEWTTRCLSRTIIPKVDFVDVPLEDAVYFVGIPEITQSYKPVIDYSKIKDIKQKITFSGRNLTSLEAIGRVAEAIGAEIHISPGKVTLVPKAKGEQNTPAQQPGLSPSDEKP